jgi:Protein of unknown function (DUF3500)
MDPHFIDHSASRLIAPSHLFIFPGPNIKPEKRPFRSYRIQYRALTHWFGAMHMLIADGALPADSAAGLTVGGAMADLASAMLDSCSPQQRKSLFVGWEDTDRLKWFYTPTDHGGLPLSAQRPAQQQLTMRLVAAGLSEAAYNTVAAVIGIENILDRVESWRLDWGRERGRDPGLYWVKIFGEPAANRWGWRFGGHHISLNYVIVGGRLISTTPCFIGVDPARSPLLGGGELAPLRAVEDVARSLVQTLTDAQLRQALLHRSAPSDIVGGNRPRLSTSAEMLHMNDPELWRGTIDDPRLRQLTDIIDRNAEAGAGYLAGDHQQVAIRPQPSGLVAAELTTTQRALLYTLVATYEANAPDGVLAKTPRSLDGVHFGWAGQLDAGKPHYYRLHGPNLLVEYDNTQRNANHAHSVWRRPRSDFGFDVLGNHRSNHPH